MARKSIYQRTGDDVVEFNMTPMIDMTFQLILFFLIAGQAASDVLAKMELSDPDVSQALEDKDVKVPNKIIVNVISKAAVDDKKVDPFLAGQVEWYQVGNVRLRPGEDKKMVRLIKDKIDENPKYKKDFFVEIRADRRVHYSGVEPVLLAAADAGVEKMNITALRDLGKK